MKKRILTLIVGSLAFWAVVAGAARWLWSTEAAVYSSVALGLCLVPTVLTLVWGAWASRQAPEQQLTMVLGGTGARMFGVLFGAWLLYNNVPYLQQAPGFWTCILVFYLFTLALEVTLLVRAQTELADKDRGEQAGAGVTVDQAAH